MFIIILKDEGMSMSPNKGGIRVQRCMRGWRWRWMGMCVWNGVRNAERSAKDATRSVASR